MQNEAIVDSQEKVIETETLIVGYGFSNIPLIRELDKDNRDYVVISEGKSIWQRLEENDRLDFDLVSSKLTSLYSFELVNQDTKDAYPTATEFLAFQRKYQKQYADKVIEDWVEEIDNYDNYSLVTTRKGKIYKATHVVISTAFRRKMNQSLNEFNYDKVKENDTVVFTTFGDSANLMVSKLVPKKVKIILLTHGFICLDKFSFYGKQSYTLDQLEFHNFRFISIRYLFKFIYRMMMSWQGTINVFASLIPKKFRKLFFGDLLHTKYPATNRLRKLLPHFRRDVKSPIPNGLIMVKYWPIDAYHRLFDNEKLEASIEKGYVLNDIAYFIENKMVDVIPISRAEHDKESKIIKYKEQTISYDSIIEGDVEVPNLPIIKCGAHSSQSEPYEFAYEFRNNYMGMIPKQLNNVYLIGYTRPSTGGSSNIVEMQCLLAYKMICDTNFKAEIYSNIEKKIEAYNRYYYTTEKKRQVDHLVYYGYYTYDVAKLLGIAPSLKDCRSIKDILQYYLAPNNAYKFRQDGPYKVEGVKALSEKIWQEHKGFSFIKHFIINFLLIQLVTITTIVLLPMSVLIKLPLILLQLFNPFVGLLHSYGTNLHKIFNLFYIAGLVLTVLYPSALVPLATLGLVSILTLISRKLGWTRLFFNDLKHKRKYQSFFKRYLVAFGKVSERKKAVNKSS